MLLSKIDWLLRTNIEAKVCTKEDSCSYIIEKEAISRFIICK
jgi:hypothetical protein